MKMPVLAAGLLFVACFSAATLQENVAVLQTTRRDLRQSDQSVIATLMGESRRMFANHFSAKADAYFHSGYYPTIFDHPKHEERGHLQSATEQSAHDHDEHGKDDHHEEEDAGFLGKPMDWIDAFGRNFFPSRHSHLAAGNERELLPWLKISAELDPHQIDTYTVASFWLRSKLGKVKEAEAFAREGLKANPDSYEIYLELAHIYDEHYHNDEQARTLYEIALQKWQKQKSAGGSPEDYYKGQILLYLSRLEERTGNLGRALTYLEQYKEFSPAKPTIEKQIAELRAKVSSTNAPPKK